jgi:hypothetical protein
MSRIPLALASAALAVAGPATTCATTRSLASVAPITTAASAALARNAEVAR